VALLWKSSEHERGRGDGRSKSQRGDEFAFTEHDSRDEPAFGSVFD
jgi:hypothetical protein